MQTKTRQIKGILKKYFQVPEYLLKAGVPADGFDELLEKCADEIAKLRAFDVPLSQNVGMDWAVVAGMSGTDIAAIADREQQEQSVAGMWEIAMGYNPLPWWSNRDLQALLHFLMDKSQEDVTTFAAWSKGKYSGLSPAKARQFPRLVIDLWKQAFMEPEPAAQLTPMRAAIRQLEKERANGN